MVVMAPKDENELCRMLVTAISHNGPISFRYPRGTATGAPLAQDPAPIPIGRGEILKNGNDLLILAIGRSVCDALDAHTILREKGISATIVNCRFVKPIDSDLICSLSKKIPRIITVEENVLQGGFGSAVLECLCDNGVSGFNLKRIGIDDTFVEHGTQDILRSKYCIDVSAIVDAAVKLCIQDD